MRLRKPCKHNRYDPHVTGYASPTCPGGEFLPEDAELIERIAGVFHDFNMPSLQIHRLAVAVLDALNKP